MRIRSEVLLIGCLLAAGICFPCPVALALDDEEIASPAAADAGQQGDFHNTLAPENVERWIFQSCGTEAKARERFDFQLRRQLEELARVGGITADQQAKLRLAAGVDISRFFADVDVVRQHVLKVKQDQEGLQAIWQEIQPLQRRLTAGVYDGRSFFAKSLRQVLSAEQEQAQRQLAAERTRYRYRAMLEVALLELDDDLALTAEQHKAVVNLALEGTRPPLVFGVYDSMFAGLQIARLPQEKLRPLFNDRQWQRLNKRFEQYRAMEQFLIQQGIVEQ